jgi:hypothetical protein
LLKVEVGLVRRALRGGPTTSPATVDEPAPVAHAVPPRPLDPLHAKLLAFLSQHATLITRMDVEVLASLSDTPVRALVLEARERGVFDAKLALEHAAPEIRDGVARALLSDEFATDDDALKGRLLDDLVSMLGLPEDRSALEAERRAAIERGDFQRVQKLTARIRSISTRLQGETSR